MVEREARQASALKSGRAAYDRLSMLSATDVHSIEELDNAVGVLISADLLGHADAAVEAYSPNRLSKIKQDIVGMMYHRWIVPDFDAYDEFMLRAGYQLPATFAEINDGRRESLSLSYPV